MLSLNWLLLEKIAFQLDRRSLKNLSETAKSINNALPSMDRRKAWFMPYAECYYHNLSNVIMIKLRMDWGDSSTNDNFLIRWASEQGHDKIVEILLNDPRINPSAHYNYAIRHASNNGHDKVVEMLSRDSRVDPSANCDYAIQSASKNGHDKVVEILLKDSRVDVSFGHNLAIRIAKTYGHHKIADILLKHIKAKNSN